MTISVATIGTGYFSQYRYDAWSRIPDVSQEVACIPGNEQKLRNIEIEEAIYRSKDEERWIDLPVSDTLAISSTPYSSRLVDICRKRGL